MDATKQLCARVRRVMREAKSEKLLFICFQISPNDMVVSRVKKSCSATRSTYAGSVSRVE
jgi:hypothetical protein